MSLEHIWKYFMNCPTVYLATVDHKQPHVRPMSLVEHQKELWMATKTSFPKTSQLEENSLMEFTFCLRGTNRIGMIRATGKAELIHEQEQKRVLAKVIPFFEAYWEDPEEDDFTLLKLKLKQIFFDDPEGDGTKQLLALGEDGKKVIKVTTVPPFRRRS